MTTIKKRFKGQEFLAETATIKADDLVAIYELLLEQFKPFKSFSRPLPEFRVKRTRRGWAHTNRHDPWFSIPTWVLSCCEAYIIYYMAHELAHHAFGGVYHGDRMAGVEKALLAPFGIAIRYYEEGPKSQRWYPEYLICTKTWKKLCNKYGNFA